MTLEEIIDRIDTDAITIFRCGVGQASKPLWQVSIRRPGTNAYSIGIDADVTKAANVAAKGMIDDDDWRSLV